eukprot:c22515_g1_i2 orf=113-1201(-)
MRNEIHDALLSVAEVAVFAFSLLELIVTRILPLGAFLAGHLLLQLCHLLSFIVSAAAGPRKPRRKYSRLRAEEELLRESFSVQHYDDWQALEDQQLYQQSLNDQKLKDRKLIASNDEADVLQDAVSATQVADVAAEIADHPQVADSAPSDAQIIVSRPSDLPAIAEETATEVAEATEQQGGHVHVADLTPSDVKSSDAGASDPPVNDADVAVVGEDQAHVSKSVSSERQSIKGLGSSDGETSEDQEDVSKSGWCEGQSEEAAETRVKSPSTEGEMMSRDASQYRSSMMRKQMRVLPPSFSDIKRSLMQRSRRSSPAQPNSPSKPIKRQSPRSRKPASAHKISTSNASFMGKFRNHFLLSPHL